jgi:hypothetical protein
MTGRRKQRPTSTTPAPDANQHRFAAVYSGRECVGHIIARGKAGVAAYDQHDRLIGIFPNAPAAANALIVAKVGAA